MINVSEFWGVLSFYISLDDANFASYKEKILPKRQIKSDNFFLDALASLEPLMSVTHSLTVVSS